MSRRGRMRTWRIRWWILRDLVFARGLRGIVFVPGDDLVITYTIEYR